MRTVLVGVRTPRAARDIVAAATRLGLAPAVRTAVSEPALLLHLAQRPADIVLVDTALTRPDCVEFTRRVLARAPGAALVLFGPEGAATTRAAVAAGARGVLPDGGDDVVGLVAQAVLLLGVPERPRRPVTGCDGPAVVPAQRDDEVADAEAADAEAVDGEGADGAGADAEGAAGRGATGHAEPVVGGGPSHIALALGVPEPGRRRADASGAAPPGGASGRVVLTEREAQVLRGMADGKSNAEIGREIFVSEDTVKTHARRLFKKLGARDRAHAVAAGFRAGLVI